MRFMTMVKAPEKSPLGPPPKALMEAIGKLGEEAAKAGVMVEMGGLLPTAMGARLRLSGGKLTVTDGPFTEAKEVIGGLCRLFGEDEGRGDRMGDALHEPSQAALAGLGGRDRASPAHGVQARPA